LEYYKTSLDGKNIEGIGAILQTALHFIAFGYKKNIIVEKFKNIDHFQHENVSQEQYVKNLNNFFNLSNEYHEEESDKIININRYYLLSYWGEIYLRKKKYLISKESKKIKYEGSTYLNKNNICVHIRVINSRDTDFSSSREYFTKEKIKYYSNLFSNLNKKYPNYKFLIFTQGNYNDFNFLNELDLDFEIMNDKTICETLYHFIFSEILVTSNSSLSWAAHLYNQNKCVYARSSFHHSWYYNTRLISKNGNLKSRYFSNIIIFLKNKFLIMKYFKAFFFQILKFKRQ